jgi:hypothetical protein
MTAPTPPDLVFDIDIRLVDDGYNSIHYEIMWWNPVKFNLRLHFDSVSHQLKKAEVLEVD